jgi:hypothetical protein
MKTVINTLLVAAALATTAVSAGDGYEHSGA